MKTKQIFFGGLLLEQECTQDTNVRGYNTEIQNLLNFLKSYNANFLYFG